jgi:uroporphyrin-III C-methyltransferase
MAWRANPPVCQALLESNTRFGVHVLMSDPLERPQSPSVDDTVPVSPSDAVTKSGPGVERTGWRASRAGVSRSVLAGIAVLAVVAAVAVWLDGRRMQRQVRTEVAQRLAGVDASTQAAGAAQAQLATDLRDAQAKIALLEARVAESQTQQAALEALYRDLAPSRDEIALSEIEQVLLMANQQVQLAGNVPSALAALQLADAKLQRLERPQFVPLRRALSRDMDQLRSVPYVDVAGGSLKLGQAIAAVGALPLAMDERLAAKAGVVATAPPDEAPWQRLLRDIWADVRQLVRVEVADRSAAPLVPPAQQYFLRENLRLRLLTARIALQNRDEASFKADLAASDAWLRQYFDTQAKTVQTMLALLKQLAGMPMAGDMPDLARSLEALRLLRLAQDRVPARAGRPSTAR